MEIETAGNSLEVASIFKEEDFPKLGEKRSKKNKPKVVGNVMVGSPDKAAMDEIIGLEKEKTLAEKS